MLVAASGCGGGATLPNPPPPISVQISPNAVTVSEGASQSFTAIVTGTNNTAVLWSVQEGAAGGTITAVGSYTAPATAGTFHVIATSQADSSKSAAATITVSVPQISVVVMPTSVTLA